jgi:hypothetical protein
VASTSNVLAMRLKLLGGKIVKSELLGVSKETEKLGTATSKTSKVTHAATGTASRLTTAYKKLGSNAKWALGIVGAGALLEIENGIQHTEELSKSTSLLTRSYGLNMKTASAWGAVAQSREIDSKSLSLSFASLSKNMVEASRKGGTLLTPFHQIGLSQENVAKGAKNFNFGLNETLEHLAAMPAGAKKMTAAKTLLGRGYQTLIPLINEGTDGMQEQLDWAEEFGVTLDGKTNKGLEEMILAQRKNKVAMLGLQVSMTKFLQPAINKGDEELQEFIKTLNSPNLTAEQKVERIGKQFAALEGDIIGVIEQALPAVAEHAGKLGLSMAGALWHGFKEANVAGKAAIGLYVFNLLGGRDLVKTGAKKVGGQIGTEVGLGVVTGVVGAYVAYELWEHLSTRTQNELRYTAEQDGVNFVNYFIREINKGLNESNPLGNLPFGLSVHAPQIHELGGPEKPGELMTPKEVAEIERHTNPAGAGTHITGKHHRHGVVRGTPGTPREIREAEEKVERLGAPRVRRRTKGAAQLLTIPSDARPSERHLHITVQSVLDGKVIAESVAGHAEDDAARR